MPCRPCTVFQLVRDGQILFHTLFFTHIETCELARLLELSVALQKTADRQFKPLRGVSPKTKRPGFTLLTLAMSLRSDKQLPWFLGTCRASDA